MPKIGARAHQKSYPQALFHAENEAHTSDISLGFSARKIEET